MAKAVGLSSQAVRNYGALGFLPPVERTTSSYRLYTARHLQALQVSLLLIAGFGWQHTRNIMRNIHQGDLQSALAVIDARHAELHETRKEIEETLRILQATSASLPELVGRIPRHRSGLHVGEAAKIAGVRVSAVRFWEQWGLLEPVRDKTSRYRVYDAEQLRKLLIVALLRKTNYGVEDIRAVLEQVANGTMEQALAAAEQRLKALGEVSRRCVAATAEFWKVIETAPEVNEHDDSC